MIAFAVVFGLLAVFLAQTWLNNQAALRMKNLEAHRRTQTPTSTIVVASRPLGFGDTLGTLSLREIPWPENASPTGAFSKISQLTSSKREVLIPIATNEPILASKITGPGQRATLSATLRDGMKAVTVRVNDVQGVAGFVLPGDRVDVVLTRQTDKDNATNDVVVRKARVLAVDQTADARLEKPHVARAATLEVDETDAQKLALASAVGTLSLVLRKAGEVTDETARRVTLPDLQTNDRRLANVEVIRPNKDAGFKREEAKVPVEGHGQAAKSASGRPTRELAHEYAHE